MEAAATAPALEAHLPRIADGCVMAQAVSIGSAQAIQRELDPASFRDWADLLYAPRTLAPTEPDSRPSFEAFVNKCETLLVTLERLRSHGTATHR